MTGSAASLFPGFEERTVEVEETSIFCRVGGSGPPLLLLHGYPQTSAMWHAVARALTDSFTVVCADLRGYGASGRPASDEQHAAYSKRAMARDQAQLMTALGFEQFAVAGHDRGGRVVHRLLLDHADRVRRAAVLDIVPTRTMLEGADMAFAMAYYHWFFLAQPADLPERMIGADPASYLRQALHTWGRSGEVYDAAALAEYDAAFADPACLHASCEDYRAGATIDLEHDRADQDARIGCPLLVLWGGAGFVGSRYDVLATWREKSSAEVTGLALDCGHFLPEERPEEVTDVLRRFLRRP